MKKRRRNSYTIEDLENNKDEKIRVDSPRSLEALKIAGIALEELYFVKFEKFIKNDPSLKKLPEDIQKSRYNFYENHRQSKIKEVLEIRAQFKSKSSSLTKANSINDNFTSKVVKNEIKRFEQMKAKNELELLTLIQNEVKKELIVKKAEEKNKKQKEKEIKQELEIKKKQKEENGKRLKLEEERKKKEAEEEEIQKCLEKARRLKEEQELKKEKEEEKKKEKEMRQKQIEEVKRQKEFQEKLRQMFEENRTKMEEKQREIENKENERQEQLELQRLMKLKELEQKNQRKRERIQKSKEDFEHRRNELRNILLDKERKTEIKRQKYEKIKKENLLEQRKKAEQKSLQLQETMLKNEQKKKEKQDEFLKKMEDKDKLIKKEIEKKHKRILIKREEQNNKTFLKNDNLKRIERIREYQKQKTIEQIELKSQRADDFKNKKMDLIKRRLILQNEISQKKVQYTSKFMTLMQKKSFDSKSLKSMKNLFPNNQKFDALVGMLQEGESRTLSSRSGRTRGRKILTKNYSSPNIDSSLKSVSGIVSPRKVKFEDEEKVRKYKEMLDLELNKLIEKEEINERRRKEELKFAKTNKEKEILAEMHKVERENANREIVEMSDVNERKAITYKIKLMKDKNSSLS